jgi:hypothetical protein
MEAVDCLLKNIISRTSQIKIEVERFRQMSIIRVCIARLALLFVLPEVAAVLHVRLHQQYRLAVLVSRMTPKKG